MDDYDATVPEGTDLEDADWEYTMEGTVCEEPVCEKAICDDSYTRIVRWLTRDDKKHNPNPGD